MATLLNSEWLTGRRVRAHAVLLAIGLWSVYAWDMAAPGLLDRNGLVKGPDFLPFYALGRIALERRGDLLYDMQAQAALRQQIVPGSGNYSYLPFYGPQASLLFAPFARLPYAWALAAWEMLSLLIYAFCCYAIWKTCPNLRKERWAVLILGVAFPGLFHLLSFGQTSALPLLCFTLAFLALRADYAWLAGFAIGSLIFKPQLGVAAAVLFLLTRQWGVVIGALLAAAAQLGIGWWRYGTGVMRDYVHALIHANDFPSLLEPRLYQSFSLRGFWLMLVPWPMASFLLYAMSAAMVLWVMLRCWQRTPVWTLRYPALLLATVLVAPHCDVYDLVILAPALLLLGDWMLSHPYEPHTPAVQVILYLCYPLFLVENLTRATHLQLGVPAMAGLLWLIWRIAAASEDIIAQTRTSGPQESA
jgi:hypothetical protein